MHVIIITGWHPAPLNKLVNSHWATAHKLKKRDKKEIFYASRHISAANSKRKVEVIIELAKGKRACDPDAYFKSLGDALTAAGMLVNDSYKWVEWMPVKYERGVTKTTVRLYDCDD